MEAGARLAAALSEFGIAVGQVRGGFCGFLAVLSPRKHRRRCPFCNPGCRSPKLPGGHEYRRRQLARKRRR